MLEFVWKQKSEGIDDAFFVRKTVFIDEQGFFDEFDLIDDIAHHLVVLDNNKTIGTARIFTEKEGEWHIGRVAVLKEYRNKGLGFKIMQKIHQKIYEIGGIKAELSAQCRASSFYEKLGYIKEGEIYLDEHCEHIKMVRDISSVDE
ncbi:MAG: GNAT family N-acetyltransferase [Oscillospiraceae bacterium]|nr:GNAT family N-acetyltransferase [Oscillospiraceae bacterium]